MDPTVFSDAMRAARLLVVDDQPANVKLLEKMLKVAGFTNVTGVVDSREVMPLQQAQPFDLILLDIRMPFMDGFEVMQKLAEGVTDDYIPVLVLTAQTDRETRIRALELGAKDFVTKPFDRIEVLSRIRNLLEVRLLHTELREQNEILVQRVRERTAEIEHTRRQVVARLGRAAEFRDNETGMHVVRMSHFSQLIGLDLGMSEQEADMLLQAAPMHDLGKIGIPDGVLLKPGKLTLEEWQIMKTHPEIGAEILGGSDYPLLQMAHTIALTHHEKWDGSGYPSGLSGADIPLVGRIVAVADVFDALTTERPYKHAWTVEQATEEIRSQAGRHFDPAVVDSFLRCLPRLLEVKSRFCEPAEAD
ncbi:MAG: response regulator [Chromatiales bacterium]|nr:response regulator [Chromatiales bacterium]